LPSKKVQFLTLDEALVIHERLIEKFGGPTGIRDTGMLESALYRPQTGYYPDLAHMATALFESLLMNHAFLDGNKRAAFFMTDIFLRLNDARLDVEAKLAHRFIIELLESKQANFAQLLGWIKEHIRQN
jgi:death-on-curing protein